MSCPQVPDPSRPTYLWGPAWPWDPSWEQRQREAASSSRLALLHAERVGRQHEPLSPAKGLALDGERRRRNQRRRWREERASPANPRSSGLLKAVTSASDYPPLW